MKVEVYVEGAGNPNLVRQCRRAFKTLFERAGMAGRLPAVIPCGDRKATYDNFVNAPRRAELMVLLLVDSEESMSAATKWHHVAKRTGDAWARPSSATEDHLHFMAQCMESWLIADRQMLKEYFGTGFRENALPANPKIEAIPKDDVYKGLKAATRDSSKGEYHKGRDSFELLARLKPEALNNLPFALSFLAAVRA